MQRVPPTSRPGSRSRGKIARMHETPAELDALDALLERSLSGSTEHLRSIIRPGEHTLSARQLADVLTGMCVLALSTVTATGEPRVSAVDGHFLNGCWVFGTSRSAAKARHLAVRPAASAAHLRGEQLGVFTHGMAEVLNPVAGPADPRWDSIHEHLTNHYGVSPLSWGDVVFHRLRPHWMVAYAAQPQALLSSPPSAG
jgi:Pyridoxamine 5'-phosphate oxidase